MFSMIIYRLLTEYFGNSLRPRLNGHHFANEVFRGNLYENWILIQISLKNVPKRLLKNISFEAMLSSQTHICVTRPRWFNPSNAGVAFIQNWILVFAVLLEICFYLCWMYRITYENQWRVLGIGIEKFSCLILVSVSSDEIILYQITLPIDLNFSHIQSFSRDFIYLPTDKTSLPCYIMRHL